MFYLPMIFTVICVIIHTYLCKKEKILYGFLFAVFFSILIISFFSDYSFKVFMILGNFMFYLMLFAVILMRSKHGDWGEKEEQYQ
jgi:uncharacterized membrane protein